MFFISLKPSPLFSSISPFKSFQSHMGCHSSKQARRDLSPPPLPRSKSLPDNHHVVSLTSSTLGSLNLGTLEEKKQSNGDGGENRGGGLSFELAKARAWSDMIDRKIPRTPTVTPPNEPEPIDALELMAGLHGDYSPLDRRSFSFYPIGHFDPIVPKPNLGPVVEPDSCNGDREAREQSEPKKDNAREKKGNAVVFYFTSLRGVRKTYDDCCSVKAILREYGVRIDERDVSMHGGFKDELKEMSREGKFTLPRVLVNGRDLRGAEEVKRMHENGELGKVFEGCVGDLRETREECEVCGDVRFVLCGHCSGSCRVYVGEEEEEEEASGGGGGWRRCSDCNENGTVRCPVCCCF